MKIRFKLLQMIFIHMKHIFFNANTILYILKRKTKRIKNQLNNILSLNTT